MEELSDQIVDIIKDYHNYLHFQFTSKRVIDWANQFDEGDREFILSEFLFLLRNGIYFNEIQGRQLLLKRIEELTAEFRFSKPVDFLANTEFLVLQENGKSQHYLLGILNEELEKKYGIGLRHCGTASRKYTIYIDDVLATGKTVFDDLVKWLSETTDKGKTNLARVTANDTNLLLSFFCRHNWPNIPWRLKLALNNDDITKKLRFYCDYEIQNHVKFTDQKLNFAYPLKNQPQSVLDYFNSITASDKETVAFRKAGTPAKEMLFSSEGNRVRFENIILLKGVELLRKAEQLKPNHRPLGAGFPSYKTFGTGTLFFTWRNISNTCPVVFWWKAGGWLPLFPLNGRGIGNTTIGR